MTTAAGTTKNTKNTRRSRRMMFEKVFFVPFVSLRALRGSGAALCCVLAVGSTPALAAPKAIRAAKVVDGLGKTIANAVIVVENDHIVSVGSGAAPPGV